MSPNNQPAHLKKLCVGVSSFAEYAGYLAERQSRSLASFPNEEPWFEISTRNAPKRMEEILAGGSLYWVINRVISVRNRIISFKKTMRDSGQPVCYIRLSTKPVPVAPHPHRPFQGWRYLEDAEKPQDLGVESEFGPADNQHLPEHLLNDLRKLGLV